MVENVLEIKNVYGRTEAIKKLKKIFREYHNVLKELNEYCKNCDSDICTKELFACKFDILFRTYEKIVRIAEKEGVKVEWYRDRIKIEIYIKASENEKRILNAKYLKLISTCDADFRDFETIRNSYEIFVVKDEKDNDEFKNYSEDEREAIFNIVEKHNVSVEVAKKVVDYLNELARAWYDNYYKSNKYEKLNELIDKFNSDVQVNQFYKFTYVRKAISTHMSEWLGWKVLKNEVQKRCTHYGGYVMAFVAIRL